MSLSVLGYGVSAVTHTVTRVARCVCSQLQGSTEMMLGLELSPVSCCCDLGMLSAGRRKWEEKSAFVHEPPTPSTGERYFVFEKLRDNSRAVATAEFGLVAFSFSSFGSY